MRGGVLTRTRTNPLDAHVKQIIQESTLELFSHGTKGIIYKVHYHGADSGFLDVLTGRPATTFIMKIIPVDMLILFKNGYVDRSGNLGFIKQEVYAQSKVYKDSLDTHGCAPCPAVLHDFVYTVKELQFMKASFAYGFDKVVEVPTQDQDLRAGVIFMECLSATTLNRTPNLSQRRDAIRLLFMTLECGIDHGDPATDNFLVDDKGQLTLIDFGSSKQLTPEETSRLKRMDVAELQREFTKRYKVHTWLLEEPFEMGPYPPRLPDKTVEQCREGLCYLDIDEGLLTNEDARYHELYERQERIKEHIQREARERERERERVKRERERERGKREREEREREEREAEHQKRTPAIQRKIDGLLQTYYTPKIPVEDLPYAAVEKLRDEIIRLKGYIPPMNMLQLFNEGDERSIYISYLTKIAHKRQKAGTRRKKYRKGSRNKL